MLQLLACVLSNPPFFTTSVPPSFLNFAALLFIPSLHRTMLLDTRVLLLQLRQFETWFLLGKEGRGSCL